MSVNLPIILLDASTSGPTPYTSWVAIGIGVVTIVYVVVIKPSMGKKAKDPLARPPTEAGLARHRAVERDVSNLLVELAEMTRQMTGQIDTRAAKLEALIQEADEKIQTLRSLGHGGHSGTAPHGVLVEAKLLEADAVRMRPADDAVGPIDPRHAEVYDLADEGQSAQDIARHTGRPSGEVELILALRGR
jgi:hypothetical protein